MADLVPANAVQLVPEQAWLANRDKILSRLRTFDAIEDEETYRAAGAVDSAAKKAISELSKMRLATTRQIDALKKNIMEQERALVADISAEEARVNKLMVAYYTAQARKREEEERRIAEAQRREAEAAAAAAPANPFDMGVPAEAAPVPVPTTEIPRTETNRGSKTFAFKVVDPTLVPREFCTPDERLIRAYVQQQKTLTGGDISLVKQIPGINITVEYKVSAR